MSTKSRREFLGQIGSGIGGVALGFVFAERLGIARAFELAPIARLRFGALDPLVDLIQATQADALLPLLVQRLRAGTALSELVAAGALANSRALGGTDYNGYHALMALLPSYDMAAQMPAPLAALPVLKVLHRTTRFIHDAGKSDADAIEPIEGAAQDTNLVDAMRRRDRDAAEQSLVALTARSPAAAYEQLQKVIRDDINVHRIVLAWRAFDLLRLTGDQHAATLLRQSVRFCIDEDTQRAKRGSPVSEIAALLPKLLEEHHLNERPRGTRAADDGWIEQQSATYFGADRATAAAAAAAALAEGFDPEAIGAALSLAATRLVLHDPGRKDESAGKPRGSMHGASVGIHASDSVNAWRHLARLGDAPNTFANLITAAFHTAGQSSQAGAEPFDHASEPCTLSDPAALLREIDGRIRDRDQRAACIAARRYCELSHPADPLFSLLLGFAVSEDGALHSEKYFRTAQEEHAAARPAHRAPYLVALTRALASGFGFPAPGCEEARQLLTA